MSDRSHENLPPDFATGWRSYLEKHSFPGIRVGMTPVGRGVFAARDFRAGEQVLTFHGARVEGEEGRELSDTVQIGADSYVDPIPPVKFVNHHCEPNTGLRHGVELHALRAIPEGEEICFDYSTCMGESFWTMECRCGSPVCRGVIRDFALLPESLKVKYTRLGIVQKFLLEPVLAATEE